jgi:hypothetical protein
MALLDPDHGGKWLFVYERNNGVQGQNYVFAKESTDPLAPTLSTVAEVALGPGVDPSVMRLTDDSVVVLWQGNGCSYSIRARDGSYSKPGVLFDERAQGLGILEPVGRRVHRRSFVVYDRKPFNSPYLWDIAIREVIPGTPLALTPPVVVAKNAVGLGPAGNQTRALVSATGKPDSLIIPWSQDMQGAERPIVAAISKNNGRDWGVRSTVAVMQGHDLVNPFPLFLTSPNRLRVYFWVRGNAQALAWVESTDGGEHWGPVSFAQPPLPAQVERVVLAHGQAGIYAFGNAQQQTKLCTWLVEAV